MQDAMGVAMAGNYAYVADTYNGLLVVDVSDPTTPQLVADYDPFDSVNHVKVDGKYAYIIDDNRLTLDEGFSILMIHTLGILLFDELSLLI